MSSANDPLEDGADAEESGDRWYGLDLSKALRFYQQAYDLYGAAVRLEPAAAMYNGARLRLHVYTRYEQVAVEQLPGLSTVLYAHDPVVGGVQAVVAAHRAAWQAETAANAVTADLMFNVAVACTLAAEEGDVESGMWGVQVLAQLVLGQAEASEEERNDTAAAAFRLCAAVWEAGGGDESVTRLAQAAEGLVSNPLAEVQVALAYCGGARIQELLLLEAYWNDTLLAPLAEGYMAAGDLFQAWLDRHEKVDDATAWRGLTALDRCHKLAQTLLQERVESDKAGNSPRLGQSLVDLATVCIARADSDLQRLELALPQAAQHRAVLRRNAAAFATRAINAAKTSGGLREDAVTRQVRKQREQEARERVAAAAEP